MTAARRRPLILILLAAIALVLAGSAWAGLATGRLSTGCTFTPAERCLRVLFIGNSYTSVNDLPHTFARLAASGGWGVETSMIAPGGALLADEVADPAVGAAIDGGSGGRAANPWTAVVLQEQSEVPAMPSARDASMAPAVSTLVRRVLMASSRPYLLETWAHRDGLASAGLDYAAMQAAIDDAYHSIGRQAGATVVPAGEAWQRALAAEPAMALWGDDGSHPTLAGTYLAACVVYATLTGQSPAGLGDTDGLDAAAAAALQRIAAGG